MKWYIVGGIGVVCFGAIMYGLTFLNTTTYDSRVIDARSGTQTTDFSTQTATSQTATGEIKMEDGTASTCEETLRNNLKKNNTDYRSGSIIVAFKDTVSFTDALTIVSNQGFTWSGNTYEQDHFSQSHLLTADVSEGSEVSAACSLQSDSHVQATQVNVLFNLHQ